MSYIAARFDFNPELLKDKELVDLFRNRDNDEVYKRPENKGLLYSTNNLMSEDGRLAISMNMHHRIMLSHYWDPTWASMNDKERIEAGLPTKFFIDFMASPKAIFGLMFYSRI